MNSLSWNPLDNDNNADVDIVSAARKRQIKNILKSYFGMYDSFSELIQNAMDAVDKRENELKEDGYEKKLWLIIDLAENSFTVIDNGIAFNEKEFKSFLAPNISFKSEDGSRGNKGVGATYIAYGFDYLLFGTKGNNYEYIGEIIDGRKWVDDKEGVETSPVVNQISSDNPIFKLLDRGSIFKVKFGGEKTRPKDLSWYSATTPEQWLYLLLLKTPLGSINLYASNQNDIQFELTVIKKDGEKNTKVGKAKYIYPHNIIKASVDLKDVLRTQQQLLDKGLDASKLPNKFSKLNGIYEFFDTENLAQFKRNDTEFQKIISNYKVEAYGYFTYSTAVWDTLNDSKAKLRKGFRVLRGGLQLANNNMIQGELITIPLTSNIGYQNQAHVIVHFTNADPDLGRKGFDPEWKSAAEDIAVGYSKQIKEVEKYTKIRYWW